MAEPIDRTPPRAAPPHEPGSDTTSPPAPAPPAATGIAATGIAGVRRRALLKGGAAATLALAATRRLSAAEGKTAADGAPAVSAYRELGRTGLRVSDISFGSSRLASGEDVVRFALDHGINYFDTAESYRGGRSEETLGRALAGRRDEVILASKVKCDTDTSREALMETLESSLRRLRTDRIDVYFNHAVNDPDRLRNPEWSEFVERARAQGKIRFTGMSGHGGRLASCLAYALDEKLFDVFLVAYNFGQDPSFMQRFTRSFDFVAVQPELPRLLRRAHAEGVGVIAMKTLMGARLNDMRPHETEGGTFAQAAFRWVLSNGDVDALIVSITEVDQIREYLAASGQTSIRSEDLALLERYLTLQSASFCRLGCDACHAACPEGVSISDALRARMYANDYGDPELGRSEYAFAGRPAAACASCSHTACLGACPYGLPIASLARDAHQRLG